jgi:uncharacterized protein (DUF1810 family)
VKEFYDLQRFINAQQSTYEKALSEIKKGQKNSHWMWYIFPQFKGLGRSEISKLYSIESRDEAISYYNHEILGFRLKEITEKLLLVENKSAIEILGSPDHYKMKSSMTLFHLIQNESDLFVKVLEKYYDGNLCSTTKKQLTEEE